MFCFLCNVCIDSCHSNTACSAVVRYQLFIVLLFVQLLVSRCKDNVWLPLHGTHLMLVATTILSAIILHKNWEQKHSEVHCTL